MATRLCCALTMYLLSVRPYSNAHLLSSLTACELQTLLKQHRGGASCCCQEAISALSRLSGRRKYDMALPLSSAPPSSSFSSTSSSSYSPVPMHLSSSSFPCSPLHPSFSFCPPPLHFLSPFSPSSCSCCLSCCFSFFFFCSHNSALFLLLQIPIPLPFLVFFIFLHGQFFFHSLSPS